MLAGVSARASHHYMRLGNLSDKCADGKAAALIATTDQQRRGGLPSLPSIGVGDALLLAHRNRWRRETAPFLTDWKDLAMSIAAVQRQCTTH